MCLQVSVRVRLCTLYICVAKHVCVHLVCMCVCVHEYVCALLCVCVCVHCRFSYWIYLRDDIFLLNAHLKNK